MKQQYEQQDNQYSSEQTAIIRQEPAQQTCAGLAKNRVISKYGMTEQEWAIYDAAVSIGLLTLRTAFPTQARNYSDREHDMLTAVWLEMFAEVKPDVLHEAIMRFIATDRKGFFPPPGLVMGCVEDIQREREWQETEKRMKEHAVYLREIQRRIDNGENCSTCKFCVHREVKDKWDSRKTEMGLFCQNPESYKYEGDYGYGTAASILCDYYEPRPQLQEKNETESEADLIERD